MKEFKFACPVCGQHITAASGTSGTQIQCPTCFQKIIVPQERSDETKLILNAAMADRPRPPQTVVPDAVESPKSKTGGLIAGIVIIVVIGAVAGTAYKLREQLGIVKPPQVSLPKTNVPAKVAKVVGPIPTNSSWTMDVTQAVIPNEPVDGVLRGEPFILQRATLQGGTLSIRQGKGWPPELAVAIQFPAKHGEELAGKKVVVTADQPPPVPKVVMRWKNEQGKSSTKTFAGGYMLRLDFGKPENEKMPGEIYIALPDDQKSFLAGKFVAEIRPPEVPKKKPKQPAAPTPAQ